MKGFLELAAAPALSGGFAVAPRLSGAGRGAARRAGPIAKPRGMPRLTRATKRGAACASRLTAS
jgi:hypothetical protein